MAMLAADRRQKEVDLVYRKVRDSPFWRSILAIQLIKVLYCTWVHTW